MEISYQLPWPPSVNHIYSRTKKGGLMLNERARAYREEVIYLIGKGHTKLDGRLAVRIDAYAPDRRKRDISNLEKCIGDALTHAGVWKDDEQIDQLIINRKGIETPGRVIVTIKQIHEI